MSTDKRPDHTGESPLLCAPPRPAQAGTADEIMFATLSLEGQAFAFDHGHDALIERVHEDCFGATTHALSGNARWHFADPSRGSGETARPVARPTLPHVIGRGGQSEEHVVVLYVPADTAWYEGHFPGDPILPAVVQVSWAIHFASEYDLCAGDFAGMDRLKFRAVILPGSILRLTLAATGGILQFNFESSDGPHSQGKIRFQTIDERPSLAIIGDNRQ